MTKNCNKRDFYQRANALKKIYVKPTKPPTQGTDFE